LPHPPEGTEPRGEHAVEHAILALEPDSNVTTCLGERLLDGVNAVPLTKDAGGKRAGNVEADMLLLTSDGERSPSADVPARGNVIPLSPDDSRLTRPRSFS
jgi:hypothetical protein